MHVPKPKVRRFDTTYAEFSCFVDYSKKPTSFDRLLHHLAKSSRFRGNLTKPFKFCHFSPSFDTVSNYEASVPNVVLLGFQGASIPYLLLVIFCLVVVYHLLYFIICDTAQMIPLFKKKFFVDGQQQ